MRTPNAERIILLVEDSDDDAFFFERAFVKAEVPGRVVRVPDGRAAVDHLLSFAQSSPDLRSTHLVFLDLKLPVLNGFDVLRWIGEQGIRVEVVVLSGSNIESDIRMARELGASDYLVKPISADALKKRLASHSVTP